MVWFYRIWGLVEKMLEKYFQSHYGLILSKKEKWLVDEAKHNIFQSHYGLILS